MEPIYIIVGKREWPEWAVRVSIICFSGTTQQIVYHNRLNAGQGGGGVLVFLSEADTLDGVPKSMVQYCH
jgi:hypothetical protein